MEECKTMMREMNLKEFLKNPEPIIKEAAANGDFTAVKVGECKAIIISEEEWKIMCEGLKMLFELKT